MVSSLPVAAAGERIGSVALLMFLRMLSHLPPPAVELCLLRIPKSMKWREMLIGGGRDRTLTNQIAVRNLHVNLTPKTRKRRTAGGAACRKYLILLVERGTSSL